MSHDDSTTYSEQFFETRLAQIEPRLTRWARRRYSAASAYDREEALQETRIVLWRRYRDAPDLWSALPAEKWLASAYRTYRYAMLARHRAQRRKPTVTASDMCEERDLTAEEALTLAAYRRTPRSIRPRAIHLAELRVDLERAVTRGLRKLCASQRRDMPRLIADMLAGYTLDEITARHGWTRHRGVTLMRTLRTVFYTELTGQPKTGYLGTHHPLSAAEKQRIRALYADGLSYRQVAARVGRSAAAVEGLCKRYPPELVAQVRALRAQGLSYRKIARRVRRSKSYVGWLLQATGGGDDLAAVAVNA